MRKSDREKQHNIRIPGMYQIIPVGDTTPFDRTKNILM
jgi:hypothetical protein